MSIKQLKVNIDNLEMGMYISSLDRPWSQTPFPLQGFFINSPEDICNLKIHCNYVYIDIVKGNKPADNERLQSISIKSNKPKCVKKPKPVKVKANSYNTTKTLSKEIKQAKQLHLHIQQSVANIFDQFQENNEDISIATTKQAASDMVDSIIRCPEAFTWLNRLQVFDQHSHGHSIRSSVLGILFGRHLGLSKTELDNLALALLLKDIGKTELPRSLLLKSELNDNEQSVFETFVSHSVDIMSKVEDIPPQVISIVKTHRERMNGTGFPDKLMGHKTPLLGRIAGMVSYYDEITTPRNAPPLAPSKATSKLYEARDSKFQGDLVVEFIQAIGIYPCGTLVELTTGEVGIIIVQSNAHRLKPEIMMILDEDKSTLFEPIIINLMEFEKSESPIDIVSDLPYGSYDIDVPLISKRYLENQENNGLLSKFKSFFGEPIQ